MYLYNRRIVFVALFLLLVVLVPNACAQRRATVRVYRHTEQSIPILLDSPDWRTVADVARITSSPIVSWTENGQAKKWQASESNRVVPLVPWKAYIVYPSVDRTIEVTGRWWPASVLKIPRVRGFELVVNHRPDTNTLVEQFRKATQLLGIVLWTLADTRSRWSMINEQSSPQTRFGTQSMGVLSETTGGMIVLPNSDFPCSNSLRVPLAATSGTTIPIGLSAQDPDDEVENIVFRCEGASSDGRLVSRTGSSITEFPTTGTGQFSMSAVGNDGLIDGFYSSPRVRPVDLLDPDALGEERICFDQFPMRVHQFGLDVQLPDMFHRLASNAFPDDFVTHIIGQERVSSTQTRVLTDGSVIEGAWKRIDTTPWQAAYSAYLVRYGQTRIGRWPVPIQWSVATHRPTTESDRTDLLVERTIAGVTFHHFAFTKPEPSTQPLLGKDPVNPAQALGRIWSTKMLPGIRRVIPVSVKERFAKRDLATIEPVHPNAITSDSRKKVLILVHGFNSRLEFCVNRGDADNDKYVFDEFLGEGPGAIPGFAENIQVLEKSYDIYRALYTTYRTPEENAQRIASVLESGLFANGQEREIVFISKSMGGLVTRYVMNKFIRGQRIGERVRWHVTIGTPHHGAAFPHSLQSGAFDYYFEAPTKEYIDDHLMSIVSFGCLPPSPGLDALKYDGTWTEKIRTTNNSTLVINAELTAFNQSVDAYRMSTNVITIGCGTSGLPLPNHELEAARRFLDFSNPIMNGFSDGVVNTYSSIPMDLFGEKGSIDEYFGRLESGEWDRQAYYDGLDHYQMLNPDIVMRLQTFLSDLVARNHAPVDHTLAETMDDSGLRSGALYGYSIEHTVVSTADDADGDALVHHWSLAGTLPSVNVRLENIQSATPTIFTTQPANILLHHTVRDSRGGITYQLIVHHMPDVFAIRGACGIPRYRFMLSQWSDGSIHWQAEKDRCDPDPRYSGKYFMNPYDPSTEVERKTQDAINASLCFGRRMYYYYNGPRADGLRAFSNVAVLQPTFQANVPR